jgi:hypothetical protein
MYSIAKTMARERLRFDSKLVAPMSRLWHVALKLSSTASSAKSTNKHEVRGA